MTHAPSAPPQPARSREIAWRVLAHELTSSSQEEKGVGEKAPTHLITPLGARVSRLLLVGSLTQIEPRGREEAPLWRARFSDPTGGFSITAGVYQPRALAFLSQARPPCRAAVVGKAHLFTGRDGTALVSVRAEEIAEADELEEMRWRVEAARQTLQRIELAEKVAASPPELGADAWVAQGYPRRFVESAIASRGKYPAPDLAGFRASAWKALDTVASPSSPGS